MARPDARKIGGLKKGIKKYLARDTGMARPDTRKIRGVKKKKRIEKNPGPEIPEWQGQIH